jgi:hypothetical protein
MEPAPFVGPETTCAQADIADNSRAANIVIAGAVIAALRNLKRKLARKLVCVIQDILFRSESLEL